MRIFIVCNSLGAGGAERVGVNLANGFAHHGHEVYIITDIYQDVAYPVDENVKVLPMIKQKCGKVKKYMQTISNIRAYAKIYQPDVAIGMMHLPSFLSKIGLIGLRIPVILTIHNALETVSSYNQGVKIKLMDRYLSRIYSRVTVLTKADKDCFAKNNKKVIVMPNPLTFSPTDIVPPKMNVIFAAGRINDWNCKGWDLLIDAWAIIAKKYPNWKVQLAGFGNEKNIRFLKELISLRHLDKQFELLGYQKDMLPFYQSSAIYVLSSRSEGLPMVLIEAMSQGCAPVACSNLGRTKEIITSKKEGVIYETSDIVGMAKAIETLISNDKLRNEIQAHAIKRSEFYVMDNVVKMWEKLFLEL